MDLKLLYSSADFLSVFQTFFIVIRFLIFSIFIVIVTFTYQLYLSDIFVAMLAVFLEEVFFFELDLWSFSFSNLIFLFLRQGFWLWLKLFWSILVLTFSLIIFRDTFEAGQEKYSSSGTRFD